MGGLIAIGVIAAVVAMVAYLSVRVVRPSQRLVIFRLGRTRPDLVRGPGVTFVLPIIDRGVVVDLRERVSEVTVDRAPAADGVIGVDLVIRYRVVDAYRCTINVADLDMAVHGVTGTILRKTVADQPVLALERDWDRLAGLLRSGLGEIADRWGVSITSLEIRRLEVA